MARHIVCKYEPCKDKKVPYIERDTMFCLEKDNPNGKPKKLYYHHECYEKHLRRQQVIEVDNKEKDILNSVVKSIYKVPEEVQLPSRFWFRITNLREGNDEFFVKKGSRGKKYKSGVRYIVIAEAYKMAREKIVLARLRKKFKTFADELMYGVVIMYNYIYDAHMLLLNKHQNEVKQKALEDHKKVVVSEERKVVYKKKQDDNDISFLLD